MAELRYKRILLKVSGEGFSGTGGFGLDNNRLNILADQIIELSHLGVQVAIVVGGGNFIRGADLSRLSSIQRATADQMGMLATVINALALQDTLESQGAPTRVLSAIVMTGVCEPFSRREAIDHLEAGLVVILAGGTGNPFFTTDTCAALRAAQIEADVLIKATKVDGVYSSDPVQNTSAQKFDRLSFMEVIKKDLKVMDHAAISLCRESGVDILVCNLMKTGSISEAVQGGTIGTLITHSTDG
ncbi:MAG: UMP kinase [Sedimentisphaerales bacterium]|nr:UMP kinase [Sedimentisphaerales bacterium]